MLRIFVLLMNAAAVILAVIFHGPYIRHLFKAEELFALEAAYDSQSTFSA